MPDLFIPVGCAVDGNCEGYGHGVGFGHLNGDGYGNGWTYPDGDGYGNGDGYNAEEGDGYGDGCSDEDGYGFGCGDCHAKNGYGCGYLTVESIGLRSLKHAVSPAC